MHDHHSTPVVQLPNQFFFMMLFIILAVGGMMRFADLGGRPGGLFRDEAEKGYNGWALASSGSVIDVNPWNAERPISVKSWPWMLDVSGATTSAIYQYASIPFVKIFGLNIGATRMASAFFGALTVLLAGLIFRLAWGGWFGLAIALWLALCPWHLVFSRWALQGIFVPFFLMIALWGSLGVERGRRWGWPMIGAALGWMFYAYSGAQPFVAAWAICLIVIHRRRLAWRQWPVWVGLILFLLPVIPTLLVQLAPGGSKRLARVAIWSDPAATPVGVAWIFFKNYFAHLNPIYLFVSGDALPRHAIPGVGQLTWFDLVLLPVGLIWTWRRNDRGKRPALAGTILAAFLCAPLPAAITHEGIPHALRSFAMVVPAMAWSGAGLVITAGWLQKRLVVPARTQRLVAGLFIFICVALNFNFYFLRYWRMYDREPLVQIAFEAGQAQAWNQIVQNRKDGQHLWVSSAAPYALYYYLFFNKLEPEAGLNAIRGGRKITFFDANRQSVEQIRSIMQPGDWLVDAIHPAMLRDPQNGQTLLTDEEARKVRDPWVMAWQK